MSGAGSQRNLRPSGSREPLSGARRHGYLPTTPRVFRRMRVSLSFAVMYSVSAVVAERAVRGRLAGDDGAEVLARGREHEHAARPGREEVAVDVDLQPVGEALLAGLHERRRVEEHPPVADAAARVDVVGHPDRARGIGHRDVQRLAVGRERQAVRERQRLVEHVDAAAGARAVDAAPRDLALRILLVTLEAVDRIGEVDVAVRAHHQIVRAVEALAVEADRRRSRTSCRPPPGARSADRRAGTCAGGRRRRRRGRSIPARRRAGRCPCSRSGAGTRATPSLSCQRQMTLLGTSENSSAPPVHTGPSDHLYPCASTSGRRVGRDQRVQRRIQPLDAAHQRARAARRWRSSSACRHYGIPRAAKRRANIKQERASSSSWSFHLFGFDAAVACRSRPRGARSRASATRPSPNAPQRQRVRRRPAHHQRADRRGTAMIVAALPRGLARKS